MKKIIIIILVAILTGCSNKTAVDVVETYLNEYQSLSKNIKDNVNKILNENSEFNKENKEEYKKILLRQYKDLKYTIISEEYDHNKALIKVNIEVYDLNKADKNASDYLIKNMEEFYNDKNEFDNKKYISYKLKTMLENNERINYDITFFLNYKNNRWILEQPTDNDLEKIHGIYQNE